MTPEQEAHLKRVKDRFCELVEAKYRRGQQEHGGDLWKKPGVLDMAIEEVVDLPVYLFTLADQLKNRPDGGRKVVCWDMDGTLSYGESWTPEQAAKAEPITANIERCNRDYTDGNFIVIYTARRDDLIPATLEWLRRNNVRYHAWSNQKIGMDVLKDDKAVNPNA